MELKELKQLNDDINTFLSEIDKTKDRILSTKSLIESLSVKARNLKNQSITIGINGTNYVMDENGDKQETIELLIESEKQFLQQMETKLKNLNDKFLHLAEIVIFK